jgi:hypothetical protein
MITNYLTIAIRNFLKRKTFSLINILGLSIGMAACFLILLWAKFELSYDTFHQNLDHIYRLRGGSRADSSAASGAARQFASRYVIWQTPIWAWKKSPAPPMCRGKMWVR